MRITFHGADDLESVRVLDVIDANPLVLHE